VQPDERAVGDLFAAAARRARWLGAVEATALAGAAILNSRLAALLVATGYVWWMWQRGTPANVVAAIEDTHPDARNVLVTAQEITSGTLAVKPAVRDRVMGQAAAQARRVDLALAFPVSRIWPVLTLAAVVWVMAGGLRVWRGGPKSAQTAATRPAAAAALPVLRFSATVRPPSYTGGKAETFEDPAQIAAIEGSMLTIAVETPAQSAALEHDGVSHPLARSADNRMTGDVTLQRTGFLVIAADNGARRTLPLVVSPDALPSVKLTAPGRDLVYAGGNARIAFDAKATDDFGLRTLTLEYTKVSGSGEQFDFKEGQLPLSINRTNPRDWEGRVSRSLAELDLKEGDTLVYRAVAADQRPGEGRASSDAFFIEISKLGVAAGDAFTLPEQETRYALSQQMLIVKTDRLIQRRASMPPGELAEASVNLAVEQRMIRAEFVFMLGGEVNDEEVEAEQSVELQAGRLANRGQRDLRTATIEMSRAEKMLTGVSLPEALAAERAAVAALQRAFARDRYILRALGTKAELDANRRLTGVAPPLQWRRDPAEAASNRRAALLQNLLKGVGDLTLAAGASGASRNAVIVLAEEALRADAQSAVLRQASVDLQALAGRWPSLPAAARAQEARAIANRIAPETRRALADAPLPSFDVASSLRAAFERGKDAR
jgi:hypothetical protein